MILLALHLKEEPITDLSWISKDIYIIHLFVQCNPFVITKKVDTIDKEVDIITKEVTTITKEVNTIDKEVDTITKEVNTIDKEVTTIAKEVMHKIAEVILPSFTKIWQMINQSILKENAIF